MSTSTSASARAAIRRYDGNRARASSVRLRDRDRGGDRAAPVGGDDPTYRPLHSAVLLNTMAAIRRTGAGTYRPAMPAASSSGPAADGVLIASTRAGERLSFRFSTWPSRAREGSSSCSLNSAGPVSRSCPPAAPRAASSTGHSRWRLRRRVVRLVVDGFGQKEIYGAEDASNHTGYCQRLVTADLDQADRILDDAQRARVLNRVDRARQGRPRDPALPDSLGVRVQGQLSGTSSVVGQSPLERGGLVARALALAAAIAVSLLAVSGAGGADAQTPKRGGTVVVASVSEPACLNPLRERCVPASSCVPHLRPVLEVRSRSPPTPAARASSRASTTRRGRLTLTYRIRPEARWSDGSGHRGGLRFHPPGSPEVPP